MMNLHKWPVSSNNNEFGGSTSLFFHQDIDTGPHGEIPWFCCIVLFGSINPKTMFFFPTEPY